MKVLFINSVCGIRSTGRICAEQAERLAAEGHEVKIAYGRVDEVPEKYEKYAVRIGTDWDTRAHALRTRLTDGCGFGSRRATRRFLAWAEEYQPDLLWLHNIHGYYINVEMLFAWIRRRPEMQVRWTLHDCWAFTGHCAHFTFAGCERWKNGCFSCPERARYPASAWDGSRRNWARKKAAFSGVSRMQLITPSHWLAGLVRQSFLGQYPVEVEHNRIDTEVFKPTPGDFRRRYALEDKRIVLGVASVWDRRKGLDDFVKLAGLLDERCAVVLVGLTEKQAKAMPANVLAIPRTNDARELAEIYTAADVFVNPSYEDNYPTVNLEAQACGTPVVTYDTGGCRETLCSEQSRVVPAGDLKNLLLAIG